MKWDYLKNYWKTIGLPVLSVVLVCFYPCAFLFFRNAGEAKAVDMLPFFGLFLLTAAIGFGLGLLILRNAGRAALLTDLGMLVVINFTILCGGLKRMIPGFRDMILLILVCAALLALLILFLRKKPDMTIPCGLIALMFGVMTLVNLIPALPTLIAAASYDRSAVAVDEDIAGQTFQGEQRNFYYMIFDEYGGPENLRHYFDYDNEPFLTALEDRGFTVSRTSRNTESPWTVTLVPNIMNLQYVTSDQVAINNRMEWLEDPVIYQLFRANGYQVNLVNHNGLLGETGCRVLTRDQSMDTISLYLYENSIFCLIPRLKWVIEDKILHRGENGYYLTLENAKNAMIDCWEAARGEPTLTVSYLMSPHAPFLFDEAGNLLSSGEYYNWHRPELYLVKLEYTSAAILEAVDNIQKNDPRAVILLAADHGCRLPGLRVERFGGPWFDTDAEIPYMENVLLCVYLPEDIPPVDVEGDTVINAARKTLDAVYGLHLGTLPVPEQYTIPEEYMPPAPENQEDSDG